VSHWIWHSGGLKLSTYAGAGLLGDPGWLEGTLLIGNLPHLKVSALQSEGNLI
jgi:hypothetical protein